MKDSWIVEILLWLLLGGIALLVFRFIFFSIIFH